MSLVTFEYMRSILLSFLFMLFPLFALAQGQVFHGQVIDAETGELLPYVNIRTDRKATLTNNDGDFKLTIGEDDVVTFSYVGYVKKTVKAAEMPPVIRLKPFTALLKEVSVGPVNYDEVLKITIDNLKRNYREQGKLARKYFFRTLMERVEGTYIAEAFLNAYSVVNIRSASIISGLQGSDTEGNGGTLNVNASNIHRLIEVAPMTIKSSFWGNATRPLQHYSYTREYYDVKFQHLFGEDGESLYRIDFSLKEDSSTMKPYIVGTAYVDTETCRLLCFDGSCKNYHMNIGLIPYSTTIDFHLEYDYGQGVASVSSLAVSGGNALMLYHVLLFSLDEDKLPTGKMKVSGSNIVTALKDAGFDARLWDEYDIVKRTKEEERVAFGR